MTSCWIIYRPEDLPPNLFFASRLAEAGRALGMDVEVVTTDSVPDGRPDVAVNRTRSFEVAAEMESRGALVTNPPEAARVCNDKLETYRLAESAGVPVLRYAEPGDPLPPGPPWVVKSREGHGGEEVMLARDEDGVRGCVERIGKPSVVQEAGDFGRDLRVYLLGGEVLAAVLRTSPSDFRANVKLGGRAELVDPPAEVAEIAVKMASRLDADLVAADFVFRGGIPYLNEMEDAAGTRSLYALTRLDPARLLMERVQSKRSL